MVVPRDQRPHTSSGSRRLPAEWEPQQAVMLAWPYEGGDWTPWLAAVEDVYLELVSQISRREQVMILCRDEELRAHLQRKLVTTGIAMRGVKLYTVPYDDTWIRDFGPLTVFEDDRRYLLDFAFNGWGDKYPARLDDRATRRLHSLGALNDLALERVDFVLEGGSIDSDGAGTLLTTRRCLHHPGRNPDLTHEEIEALLQDKLGSDRILWLDHGFLVGDDTDGHVDMLARFCDPATIAYCHCEDPADEHFSELQALARELAALRTRQGKPYRLVPLPLPAPKYDERGNRLPASYVNFLIINGAVLVPAYDDPVDAVARRMLAACFPQREILSIPATPLILQHGSIHCVTMQLPAGMSRASS